MDNCTCGGEKNYYFITRKQKKYDRREIVIEEIIICLQCGKEEVVLWRIEKLRKIGTEQPP